jgi:predicted GH43/DUF377 family glycosyl hydrolase
MRATCTRGPYEAVKPVNASFARLGTVFAPSGAEDEREGTINPASARLRDGSLALYPRIVAPGNVSRVRRSHARWDGDAVTYARDGFALEPSAPYEIRSEAGGYGCEDPRITFVAELDVYLMTYCAYGPSGTLVGIAHSSDGLTWSRLGTVRFRGPSPILGDKDAAYFPEPVLSPSGVRSIAIFHRPTFHISIAHGREIVPSILAMLPCDRESMWAAYVPLERVRADLRALLDIDETEPVLHPDGEWGAIKVGIGPPPIRVREGWLTIYHGIDVVPGHENAEKPVLQYRAGFALLDAERPGTVLYRAPEPFLAPETPEERSGIVDNVVFPTAIDPRPQFGERQYDLYYGMADTLVGRGRLTLE